jgi:hypothetical protein
LPDRATPRRAWRNHNLDAIAVRRDRLIAGRAIICAVRGQLNNRIVNLIEPRADLGRIVDGLIRQRLCHDPAARSIDRQMPLAPRPARLRARLRLQPLARSVDLQAGDVDQHVQRTMRHLCWLDHRQRHRPAADR